MQRKNWYIEVCMDAWIEEHTDGWMEKGQNAWIDKLKDGCFWGWIYWWIKGKAGQSIAG